jgi:hypothetical protein
MAKSMGSTKTAGSRTRNVPTHEPGPSAHGNPSQTPRPKTSPQHPVRHSAKATAGAVTRTELVAPKLEVRAQVQAAVAARHVRKASVRRVRSVRREMRWRWTLNVLWTAA